MLEIRLRSFGNLATRLGLNAADVDDMGWASASLLLAAKRASFAPAPALPPSDVSFCMPISATSDADGRDTLSSDAVTCVGTGASDPTCASFKERGRVVHEFAARGKPEQSVLFDALCYASPSSQSGAAVTRRWDAGHYCVMMFGDTCPPPLQAGTRRHLSRIPGFSGCSGGRTSVSDAPQLETFAATSALPDRWTVSSGVGSLAKWSSMLASDSPLSQPFGADNVWRVVSTGSLPAVAAALNSAQYSVVNYFAADVSFNAGVRLGANSSASVQLEFDNGTLLSLREFVTPMAESVISFTSRIDLSGLCARV